MTPPNRFQRLEQLFRDARSRPPDQRRAFLSAECGDDAELMNEVLALIDEDEQTRGLIDAPAIGEALDLEKIGVPIAGGSGPVPDRIGGYRIIRHVGEGGMGVVYEAEQESPRRRVALKVINAGFASGRALRRFEHEAEVLGRLQHPGIAQIFEAGTFDSGAGAQPYFAMEFINGEPIHKYAARRNLSTRQRMQLLAKICDAVQHAHQRGVIHRDLKPANILVVDEPGAASGDTESSTRSRADDVGQPKILDFGVARATDGDIQTTTMRTDIGQLIGTVPYMSPEQAAGNPDELDTRSDVYALGVISYELLAGRLPYDVGEKMIHEAVRVIREDDPTPLSSVNRMLGGDIETIIGKALEKDKARRYESASAMGSDIRRYLSDEPIAARPPSTWYQLRKFAKRNKQIVVGGAVVAAILVVATAVSTVFAIRESDAAKLASNARDDANAAAALAVQREQESKLQAQIAEAVNQFLNDDLLASVDPEQGSRSFTMREVLDIASASIGERFHDQPQVEAEIQQTLGRTYHRLGELDKAELHLRRAVELRERVLGSAHAETLESKQFLADAIHDQGRHFESREMMEGILTERIALYGERHLETIATMANIALLKKEDGDYEGSRADFERLLPLQQELHGDLHIDTLAIMTNLADVYSNLEEFEAAEALFDEALAGRRQVHGERHPRTLSTLDGLAQLYERQGRLEEAQAAYEQVIDGRREALGENHIATLASLGRMATLQMARGETDRAIEIMVDVLQRRRETLEEDHPDTLTAVHDLGSMMQQAGRYDEAEPLLAESLADRRRTLGGNHPATAVSMNNLALTLDRLGRRDEAIAIYEEALPVLVSKFGPRHSNTLTTQSNLAGLLFLRGRADEAEPLMREAIESMRQVHGDENISLLLALNTLGYHLMKQARFAEAEPPLSEAVRTHRRTVGDLHPRTFAMMNNLASNYAGMGKLDESEALFLELTENVRTHFGPDHMAVAGTLAQMCDLLFVDQPAEAEPHLREVLAIHERALPPGHTQTQMSRSKLGMCLAQQGMHEEAESLLVESADALVEALSMTNPDARSAVERVVAMYESWDRPDDAAAWRDRLQASAAGDASTNESSGGL